jgi:hypothetical protein
VGKQQLLDLIFLLLIFVFLDYLTHHSVLLLTDGYYSTQNALFEVVLDNLD